MRAIYFEAEKRMKHYNLNRDKIFTAFKMSGRVAVRYIKQPIKLLKCARSILYIPSSLQSFFFWFTRVLISLCSSSLNFFGISLAYFFWQIKTSCSSCTISIPKQKAKASIISCLNFSTRLVLFPVTSRSSTYSETIRMLAPFCLTYSVDQL